MKTAESPQVTLAGIWHNQHNSQMHLEIDDTGKIAGYFLSGVNTVEEPSQTYPLTGFARGNVLAFCVDFGSHGCMTTWIGQLVDPQTKHFQAMWQMVAAVNEDKEKEWKSFWTGQDVFDSGPRTCDVTPQPSEASHPMYCSLV